MRFCGKCGNPVESGDFCGQCGAKLPGHSTRSCLRCGAELEAGNFCGKCGAVQSAEPEKAEKMNTAFCGKCGNPVHPGGFCGRCGAKNTVSGSDAVIEPPKTAPKISSRKKLPIAAMAAVAVLVCVIVFGGTFVLLHMMGVTRGLVLSAEEPDKIIACLQDWGEDQGYHNAFSELTEKRITKIGGESYCRYQQNYQGIPVYGRDVVCVVDSSGEVSYINTNALDVDEDVALEPDITSGEAITAAEIFLGAKLDSEEPMESQLYLYIQDNGKTRLVYCVETPGCELLVDARKGDVLQVVDTVYEEAAIGYMASDTKRSEGFTIKKTVTQSYVMHDVDRNLIVYTLNNTSSGWLFLGAEKLTSEDNIFGNTSAEKSREYEKGARLLINVSEIYDYYDDLGFKTKMSGVKLYYNDAYDGGRNARGGAGWLYGRVSMGSVTGVECVDIIAHEYTHFVSRETVEWSSGWGETGAVNEAFSDILGEIIEASVNKTPIDWKMGSYRNIADPGSMECPSYYKGEYWGNTSESYDSGYIHKNSTVISHAAYLMWCGIDGTQSRRLSDSELAELWYRAMQMLTSEPDFAECRKCVLTAASQMKLSDQQRWCVEMAFARVGIGDSPEMPATDPPPSASVCEKFEEYFEKHYCLDCLVYIVDVTHDGQDDMVVVYYSDVDMCFGHVLTVDSDGNIKLIYEKEGGTSHAGGSFNWSMRDLGNGYCNLGEHSDGMWQGIGWLSFTEYYLNPDGTKVCVNSVSVDSADPGCGDENGAITDAAWDDYQRQVAEATEGFFGICIIREDGFGDPATAFDE